MSSSRLSGSRSGRCRPGSASKCGISWLGKLKIRKYLSGLYGEIIERVREDEWYVTMEESIKGLETFADIPSETLRA